MGEITGDFVARLASVWHRLIIPKGDEETLAEMLAPMDAAGERVARRVGFDMEPSDFDATLLDLARRQDD